ncbi:MAG TPA: efflux RND transporter permease subunit [Flavobacteriales bacterium]|nr:efflux RND transporter permease subunit [Flavobacteriales bacterium]
MSITEVAIKRPLLITVIFVTLILFGFVSYKGLNYNLLPKFEANVVMVQTTYRGASPEEIQNTITKPLEDAVSAIEGVDQIASTSMEGVSAITITLKTGTDVNNAQRDAERRIDQIRAALPDDADDPVVRRFSTDEIPILRMSVNSDLSPGDLYELLDDRVAPILSNVSGVGSVTLIGAQRREVQVVMDNEKLKAYGISAGLVAQAVTANSSTFPAGNVEGGGDRLSINLDARAGTVEDLRNTVVRENTDGSRILLKDIAAVTDGLSEATTFNRINGQPGIGLQIVKQSDANAVEVSKGVKERMAQLKTELADTGFDYAIAIDQSLYTLSSANAVMFDLVLAVVIVGFVMLLFLHSLRSSFFVLVALPSAMIPTFILMYAFGFSLNLMTLMALSLVVGILVDDSIVVLENIYRHLEMGKTRWSAALDGRNEIGFTAMAITLVDVVVFLPLALSGGLIGNILREFSLVVVFSTLMSLVVAFTLTPLLASRWGKLEHLTKDTLWGRFSLSFERGVTRLQNWYGGLLQKSLRRKRYVLLTILVLIIGSIALLPAGFIGAAFIPQSDRGEFLVQLETAPQTNLAATDQLTQHAERIILQHPEVVNAFTNVGTQSGQMGGGAGSSNANLSEINVKLVPKTERTFTSEQFGLILRDELGVIPGLKVTVTQTNITGSANTPIQIAVKGVDMDSLWKAARMVKAITQNTPGTDYVQFSTKSPKPEVRVRLDQDRMGAMGFTSNDIGIAVQTAFRGNDRNNYKEGGEEYPINVRLDQADRWDVHSVRDLMVTNTKGSTVPLSQLAEVYETVGSSVLERTDRLNSIKVNSAATGRPSGTIVAEIQAALAKEKLPAGVTIQYLGDAKNQGDAFGSLGMALILGILLVYLIMVALYENALYPFVVLFSIPVALVGALLALALAMQPLAIFSIVGLIMLLGLVSKNGILIVDFANHLRKEGMGLAEALVEAGKERLRPILMTTVAMIFGMLPIALASGDGAEVKNGMAWVIIGGLSSSLILTLFIVPTMYYIMTRLMEMAGGKRFSRKRKLVEERVVVA